MNRLTDWLHRRGLAHRLDAITIGMVTLSWASSLLPDRKPYGFVSAGLAVLAMAGVILRHLHGRRLCEQCVVEFSINAPEYAEQRRWRFKAFHGAWWPLAAVLSAMVAASFVSGPWRAVPYAVPNAALVVMVLASRFHAAYQPWCPYCRRDDGDGGESEEVPDPTGGHGRPLPVV